MIYYIIPARKGSKGLPFKNRKLLPFTINEIPDEELCNTYVTTNDEYIKEECEKNNTNCIIRSDFLSGDSVSIRDVLEDCVRRVEMKEDDVVVLLYLTYPQRKWAMVKKIKDIFIDKDLDSLLCKKKPLTHPYLCFFESSIDASKGSQVVRHDNYRRQDYPNCFELSFYVCMFKVKELKNLSRNMFNDETYFFPLKEHLDIDTEKEFLEFLDT